MWWHWTSDNLFPSCLAGRALEDGTTYLLLQEGVAGQVRPSCGVRDNDRLALDPKCTPMEIERAPLRLTVA